MHRFASVIFDCDSTLCTVEGIDELAGEEHRSEIERLTDAAMRGAVPLEDVYGRRLAIISPTRRQLDELAELYVHTLVPGARETVAALRQAGVRVRIISGGLRPPVERLARALEVPVSDVAAVDIFFDAGGGYAGFDESSPLARSMGKFEVIAGWRDELPPPVMLVGDGVTDLEAKGAVDTFVAFAGVVEREPVVAGADLVIRSRSLEPLLELVLRDPRTAPDLREPSRSGKYEADNDSLGNS